MRTMHGKIVRSIVDEPIVAEVAIHRMTSPAGVCWWATEAGWTSGFFRSFDQLDDHVIGRYAGRLFVRVAGECRVGPL